MSYQRRVRAAMVGTSVLAAGLAAGAAAVPAGASAAAGHVARAAAPTSERLALLLTVTLAGQHQRMTMTGIAGPTAADLHLSAAGNPGRRTGGDTPPGCSRASPSICRAQ